MVAKRKYILWTIPEKKQSREGGGVEERGRWGHTFLNQPSFGRFFTLPLEIPDITRLHPWKIHKIGLLQKKKTNSRVFQIVVKGGGESEILLARIFLRVKET